MAVYVPVGEPLAAQASVDEKLARLKSILREMGSVVVGYSGGADSALLLKVAHDELGDRAVGVIAESESYPRRERDEAVALARDMGVDIVRVNTKELQNEEYASNPENRCYYCKQELFVHLARVAGERGIKWIAYGANHDDLGDYRPGQQAGRDAGARAPMIEAGLTKPEIRYISRQLNLPTWDKPAMACLSSRFPYGTRITGELLARIEAAEEYLRADLGFRDVRVRHHGEIARLEIGPAEMDRLLQADLRTQISRKLKTLGYRYVAMELEGYRTGSLNAAILERSNGR